MNTILKTISKGTQSLDYIEVIRTRVDKKVRKLRIKIKSDSHSFQSYAYIDVWSGKWTRVHSIPFGVMVTREGLYYGKQPKTDAHFKADRDELLRVAKEVL